MNTTDKNKSEAKIATLLSLNSVAESWVRLCFFHLEHKTQLTNQNKTKYEHKKI